MKRTLAAAITAMMAGTSIWLASAPADARSKPPKPPVHHSATIKVLTRWTYQGDGKLAVTANCSQRRDLAVVRSTMLPYPVKLRHGGNLLINVTDKTKPGKYAIALWCAPKDGRVNAVDVMSVKIMKRLTPFRQPRTPALPRHFHPCVTVRSGPPAARTTSPGKNKHSMDKHSMDKHCGCMHSRKHPAKKAPVPASPVPPLSPNPYLPQAS
jgi:hypothetical protein